MNFNQFLTTQFLFRFAVVLERTDKIIFAAGAVFLALAAVFKLAAALSPTPVDKKYRNKFFNLFAAIGISEVVWFGARVQNVMFFGAHFAALLVLLIGLIWGILLLTSIIKNYSGEKADFEKEQVRLKYLPR